MNKKKKEDKLSRTDVSLDDIRDMIWNALNEKDKDSYLTHVYGSYIIYDKGGEFFKLPYSILDGEVQFGSEPVEVEKVWVEARAQQAENDDELVMNMRLGQAQDPEGSAWDVTICEPGFTKNGWHVGEDELRQAAGLFEGTDVNIYELPGKGGQATHVPESLFDIKSLLVKNKAGWLDGIRYVAGEGLKGVLHFLDSFRWLGKNLIDGAKQGAEIYGLSYDAPVRAAKAEVEGKNVMKLLKFLAVDSVDIVSRPAAGGKFNRAIAAQGQGGTIMDRNEVLALIKEKRPDLLEGKEIDKISDDEVKGLARMAMESPIAKAKEDKPVANDPGKPSEGKVVTQEEFALYRCSQDLGNTLSASDLPEAARDRIRAAFADRAFELADLVKAIADEKDYLAKMDGSQGNGGPVPGSGITGGLGTFEKAQMAMDRMFGLTKEDVEAFARMETLDHQPFFEDRDFRGDIVVRSAQDYQDYDQIPTFRSIREAYMFFTGDDRISGLMNRKKLPPDLKARMDVTSGTFTYALGNTLGRRLVKVYKAMDFKANLLISIRKPVRDFRQQEAVLVGGFPDIEDVDPETADYAEIAAVTDEESTYTVGQKGNLLTISRKTIINDDLDLIRRLVDGFARAFARTHAQYVWDFFIDNSSCSDGTAWFTSGHGNLGATALTHATAYVAWTALAKMTEKDSGKRIGLIDGSVKLNLVGPPDIKNLMKRIAHEEFYYTSNDVSTKIPNPIFEEVDDHVVTLLTDANDWGLLLPPSVVDMVEMGYLNGREEPEFFVADSPQSEQIFVADKIRHKGRHEYAGAPIDYRSGYKAQM